MSTINEALMFVHRILWALSELLWQQQFTTDSIPSNQHMYTITKMYYCCNKVPVCNSKLRFQSSEHVYILSWGCNEMFRSNIHANCASHIIPNLATKANHCYGKPSLYTILRNQPTRQQRLRNTVHSRLVFGSSLAVEDLKPHHHTKKPANDI